MQNDDKAFAKNLFLAKPTYHSYRPRQRNKANKDKESIQSRTTPDPGHRM